jgi:hypothetical protein
VMLGIGQAVSVRVMAGHIVHPHGIFEVEALSWFPAVAAVPERTHKLQRP